MALKAGRVGVAPDQVDEFGRISSEATSGYTKQEADAKFETQTHAASTYETKSDAATALAEKQPIRLSLPIELLSGSALTVEDALNGINDQCKGSTGTLTSEYTLSAVSYLKKELNFINFYVRIESLTCADNAVIATLPVGYRPGVNVNFYGVNFTDNTPLIVQVETSGNIILPHGVTSKSIRVLGSFIL